jgi:hypothetical protein
MGQSLDRIEALRICVDEMNRWQRVLLDPKVHSNMVVVFELRKFISRFQFS